jgi:hypothetical protein
MSDLVPLTDAEVELVSGGVQFNIAEVYQAAEAINNRSPVTAVSVGGGAAVALGATAVNVSLLDQRIIR